MRRVSKKTARRNAECRGLRQALVSEVGHCELCGHDPERVRFGMIRWELSCHEIANGANRLRCLDKRFGLLCVCWLCNSERLTDKAEWPVARQLCLLRKVRPQDYSLEKYVAEFHPNAPRAITTDDVDAWEGSLR